MNSKLLRVVATLAFFGVVSRAYRSACLNMASELPESDPSKASESA